MGPTTTTPFLTSLLQPLKRKGHFHSQKYFYSKHRHAPTSLTSTCVAFLYLFAAGFKNIGGGMKYE